MHISWSQENDEDILGSFELEAVRVTVMRVPGSAMTRNPIEVIGATEPNHLIALVSREELDSSTANLRERGLSKDVAWGMTLGMVFGAVTAAITEHLETGQKPLDPPSWV